MELYVYIYTYKQYRWGLGPPAQGPGEGVEGAVGMVGTHTNTDKAPTKAYKGKPHQTR